MVAEKDPMEWRDWGKRGHLGYREKARWKGGVEGELSRFPRPVPIIFCLPSLTKLLCLPTSTTSAWRCAASLHCGLPAMAQPRREVTKKQEESGPDPESPSPSGLCRGTLGRGSRDQCSSLLLLLPCSHHLHNEATGKKWEGWRAGHSLLPETTFFAST